MERGGGPGFVVYARRLPYAAETNGNRCLVTLCGQRRERRVWVLLLFSRLVVPHPRLVPATVQLYGPGPVFVTGSPDSRGGFGDERRLYRLQRQGLSGYEGEHCTHKAPEGARLSYIYQERE